ncbi:MAG: DUF4337 domain-containing protein [Candidatus Eremiobacteraeota bacterium]|nr:DUF4337 domain-containing protein [Candidatus Eremiobacteraeota bacterium]
MPSEFKAHEAVERAKESGGERSIIITAALLAVFAAVASLLANQRTTAALQSKNDAILAQARASDSWAFYQARSIKQHIDEASLVAAATLTKEQRKALGDVAAHEKAAKGPLQKAALKYEEDEKRLEEQSEKYVRSHETLDMSVTCFEVAIAMISIAALTRSRALLFVSLAAAAGGLVFLVLGYPVH